MIASKSASSSLYEVSMMHASSGRAERTSRQTSTPEPSGSRTSRTATSGLVAGIRWRASSAVPASPTTIRSPSASSRSRTPRRTTSWSSSRNTRTVTVSVCFLMRRPCGLGGLSIAAVEGQAGPRQLRRLLDAVMSVGSELDVVEVLQRIIEVATDLVDARYGALGVLDEAGTRLSQFITVGIDDEERDKIGPLPEGHGILGLLIVDPRPLRLPDLRGHPESFGFPPNHPPIRSFLGAPMLVRGRVFGNLYLCDKANGDPFTDIDEELFVALAGAAGIAIDNARLHARVADLAMFEDRERI